ncbi:hypothetical protein MTO96_030296, partial [Rhipicephalus appendiculatus]
DLPVEGSDISDASSAGTSTQAAQDKTSAGLWFCLVLCAIFSAVVFSVLVFVLVNSDFREDLGTGDDGQPEGASNWRSHEQHGWSPGNNKHYSYYGTCPWWSSNNKPHGHNNYIYGGPPSLVSTMRPVGSVSLLYSLFCTVREGFTRQTLVFPPDGLCDIITFDSLFTSSNSSLSPPYRDDFTYFLEVAALHQKTEYGIGISHEGPDTKTNLDALWDQKIYHYAQVNTLVVGAPHHINDRGRGSARGLQMLSTLMNDKKDPVHRPSYTMLHYPLIFLSMVPSVTRIVSDYPIDVLVAIGHMTNNDASSGCRMVPPVLYSADLLEPNFLNITYRIRL